MAALARHPHDGGVWLGGGGSLGRVAELGVDAAVSLCRLRNLVESRTPTVAALFGAGVAGNTPVEALEDLRRVLPGANPNDLFLALLKNIQGTP